VCKFLPLRCQTDWRKQAIARFDAMMSVTAISRQLTLHDAPHLPIERIQPEDGGRLRNSSPVFLIDLLV